MVSKKLIEMQRYIEVLKMNELVLFGDAKYVINSAGCQIDCPMKMTSRNLRLEPSSKSEISFVMTSHSQQSMTLSL